jgi:type IV pilus assembly protein PilF
MAARLSLSRILLLLFIVSLVSGCTTTITGPVQKEVDPAQVVEKLNNLGIGYLQQGDYTRSKDNLSKALEIDPGSPLTHTTFGVLFEREGEFKLAEYHFNQAIRYDPEFSPVRNNFGAFLFARGRYEEAEAQLLIASQDRFYPLRAQVFENLGVCYLRMSESVKAEDAFLRAIQLDFSRARALIELAIIRYDQQNFVEARRLYDRHVSVSQQSSRSLLLCTQLARKFDEQDKEASCALVLKNIFPASNEFKQYQKMI